MTTQQEKIQKAVDHLTHKSLFVLFDLINEDILYASTSFERIRAIEIVNATDYQKQNTKIFRLYGAEVNLIEAI